MKLRLLAMGVVATFIMASCGSENGQKAEVTEEKQVEEVAEATTYMVDAENSSVMWEGSKIVGDKHTGTIKIKSGEILVKDSAIQPGSKFVIDMNSIVDTDLTDEEKKAKLVGHLKSADFFAADSFPEATFEVTSVTPNEDGTSKIAGNLTLRGVTKNVEFNGKVMMQDNAIIASAKDVIIERTQFNVMYNNANVVDIAKDAIISNDLKFEFMVMAKK
jgi:polyisoprenoid-binding protein YceI